MEQRLYLTILRGPSPAEAVPVLATEDEEIIRAVARALGARLGMQAEPDEDPTDSRSEPAFRLLDSEPEGRPDG